MLKCFCLITYWGGLPTTVMPNKTSGAWKNYLEAKKYWKSGFEFEIQDKYLYWFYKTIAGIIRQVPDEFEKSHPELFLTINQLNLRWLICPIWGLSFRNAEMYLNQWLRPKPATTFLRADFAINSVLEQLYNGVLSLSQAKVRMGSKLVYSNRVKDWAIPMAIPNIVGMTYTEAKNLLESKGLSSFAAIIANSWCVKDTNECKYIYCQNWAGFDDEDLAEQ